MRTAFAASRSHVESMSASVASATYCRCRGRSDSAASHAADADAEDGVLVPSRCRDVNDMQALQG